MAIIARELLEILVCPICRSSLDASDGKIYCLNKSCQTVFLIRNGIPILLPPDLKDSDDSLFKESQVKFFDRWSSKERGKAKMGKASFDRFFSTTVGTKKINYSEESMFSLVKHLPADSLVLELGCGAGEHTAYLARIRPDLRLVAIDLSFKSAFETKERVRMDKKIKSKVDVLVADAERLPFKNGIFSGIIAVMFFHHTASPKKTLGEIKRTLHPKGVGLVVDITADNPFVVLPRKIFPYLPSWLKNRFKKDYLLESGEMPRVLPHRVAVLKRCISESKLKITGEDNYDLFLFTLSYIVAVLPPLKYLLPRFFLEFLYNLEKSLLKNKFFQKFTGAKVLWVSN